MNPGIFFALARSVEYSPKGSKSFLGLRFRVYGLGFGAYG
jgi:hypothetical protein